jgi:hypothetical protein
MELISKLLFWVANSLLIPDIIAVPVRSFTYFDRRHLQHVHDQT